MKTIAVLTSGGDAPGMNAAVRAVVRTGIYNDMRVMGVYNGYEGLMNGDIEELSLRSIGNIIQRGGTVLRSARSAEFTQESGRLRALETCKKFGIEGLVVIGGDGSYRGALEFSRLGVTCVGVPGTIDNDIGCTDYTIGFDTAINTVMEMVDKVRDTTESHSRCSVIEVMGRDAGYIGLEAGIAVGATSILIPEFEYDFDKDVLGRMQNTIVTGKRHFVIIVAEGCGDAMEMAKKIEQFTGIETRATILGYVQRGGSPTVRDRVLASRMGNEAVRLLRDGEESCVIGVRNEEIVHYPIEEGLAMKKTIDVEQYRMAYEISI